MSDGHQIPWGLAGPTDPSSGRTPTSSTSTKVPCELERQEWSQEGVPDVEQRLDADDQ